MALNVRCHLDAKTPVCWMSPYACRRFLFVCQCRENSFPINVGLTAQGRGPSASICLSVHFHSRPERGNRPIIAIACYCIVVIVCRGDGLASVVLLATKRKKACAVVSSLALRGWFCARRLPSEKPHTSTTSLALLRVCQQVLLFFWDSMSDHNAVIR